MRIRKGNVELDINEDFVQSYINQGYDVIDADGNVIKNGNDMYAKDLPIRYQKALDEIEKLKSEITELKAELKAKKETIKIKK